ncbi:glycosyltransferase [Phaeovulum sp.]|uniref:MraY family glycosyltransferase n=1 Tax=Phaeovulum sp. TaxID=2934796 RepID=UPI0035676378
MHLSRTARAEDGRAVQAAHSEPTPRIGGVSFVLALAVACIWLPANPRHPSFGLLALSLLPIFLAGLAEDLGFRVSPNRRLLAAAVSAALAAAMLETWVVRIDIPMVDALLQFTPLAVAFTIFASAGIANAFNLIDGLNGLAAGTGILVALGLACIALLAGDTTLATMAFVMVPAILGFLVFNFPYGKIFLGDAGAYSMGHALAWIGIVLVARSPEVSPWAIMLVFFWPIADTLFAIWRRSRSGRGINKPDQMHFHQLIMRGIEICVVGRGRRHISNPIATVVMLPMIATPIVAGVLLWNSSAAAAAGVAVFALAFVAIYLTGLRYFRSRARSRQRRREGKAAALAVWAR